jgi:hypothetical protein
MHDIPLPGETHNEAFHLSRAAHAGWANDDIVLDPIAWRDSPLERVSPIHNRRISRRARRRGRKRVEREG